MSEETRGIIMFNRGEKCLIRAIVCLYTLRQHWDGPVTFYLEHPYPKAFEDVCKCFNVDIIRNEEKQDMKVLVRKTEMFSNPPYDRTLWLDSDTIVLGKLDEMFDDLDNADCSIPHFAGWISSGKSISRRINRFKDKGILEGELIEEALNEHPAVNTGILSFRKSDRWTAFVKDWVELADQGAKAHIFIPDEVAFQILYPSADKWGIKINIAPVNFNVSVLHDPGSKDWRVLHYHGQKHVLDHKNCDKWKNIFAEMRENNTANINSFLKYADKRLNLYLKRLDGKIVDTTIVTACDEHYVEILKYTFPNWRKYKKIDDYPVIVFVHGMDIESDPRLDFLRLDNVTMIPWSMDNADDHREEMLSAFVFGTAENVSTEFWMKLDSDSYATDDRPLITDDMKKYAFCGHRWGYSRPNHIEALDKWAKGHWKRKLKNAKPMIEEGKKEGRRFYHKTKRTISFVQLHKTKFTKFCVSLLRERKLPVPSQDTFMFYVQNRFDPEFVGVKNFKRFYGFTQGKGRGRDALDNIKKKLAEVDEKFEKESDGGK